jgi:hypothetical protein
VGSIWRPQLGSVWGDDQLTFVRRDTELDKGLLPERMIAPFVSRPSLNPYGEICSGYPANPLVLQNVE